MNLSWAPGQSETAKEICRHLKPNEKVGLYGLSLLLGVFGFAIPVVLMGSAIGIFPFYDYIEGLPLPLLAVLILPIIAIPFLQRRLLLGTQFARDNGFTMSDIAARSPLERKGFIAIGLGAGLIVAIGAAAAMMIA